MTLGESLKRCRNTFGYTQKQVAKELKIFPQVYQKYESDQTTPSAKVLLNLAGIYDVSLDYLAGLSDNPRPVQIDDAEIRDALEFKKAFQNLMQEHNI